MVEKVMSLRTGNRSRELGAAAFSSWANYHENGLFAGPSDDLASRYTEPLGLESVKVYSQDESPIPNPTGRSFVDALNAGALLLNFNGHGSAGHHAIRLQLAAAGLGLSEPGSKRWASSAGAGAFLLQWPLCKPGGEGIGRNFHKHGRWRFHCLHLGQCKKLRGTEQPAGRIPVQAAFRTRQPGVRSGAQYGQRAGSCSALELEDGPPGDAAPRRPGPKARIAPHGRLHPPSACSSNQGRSSASPP